MLQEAFDAAMERGAHAVARLCRYNRIAANLLIALLFLSLALGVFTAALTGVPDSLPGMALQSETLYRTEVGFFAFLIASLASYATVGLLARALERA